MKIVADVNVLISGFLWGGAPRAVLQILRQKQVDHASSEVLLKDVEKVLTRDKFRTKLNDHNTTPAEITDAIREFSEIVEPKTIPKVCRDPDDDQVIACALTAQAICIVSGDNDLLDLKEHDGIKIMTAADFLIFLENQS